MCRCGQFTRRLGEGVRCVVVGSLLDDGGEVRCVVVGSLLGDGGGGTMYDCDYVFLWLFQMMMMMTTMLNYLMRKQLMEMQMKRNRSKDGSRYRRNGVLVLPKCQNFTFLISVIERFSIECRK